MDDLQHKALELFRANRLTEARALYGKLLSSDRMNPDLWVMLGVIDGRESKYSLAIGKFRAALQIHPGHLEASLKLALALRFTGQLETAANVYRSILAGHPDNAEAGDGLAFVLFDLGKKIESVAVFRTTLRHHPGKAERYSAFASALQSCGLLEEAIEAYRTALEIRPDLPVLTVLAGAYLAQGRLEEAERCYRDAVARQPNNSSAHSGLLMMLNYLPSIAVGRVYEAHRDWGRSVIARTCVSRQHVNKPDPERKLRIGYVSPDFRRHSVAFFFEPLLARHDRMQFEIFCYSMMPRPDDVTRRLQGLADFWRPIYGISDDAVAAGIRQDGIDILVDLAGHSANNSLAVFARKPAPVQMTWLGYPNTSGLDTIDYRITDAVADPTGEEPYYTEQLLRLPGRFLCYQPPATAPAVGPQPCELSGTVTFGSFNNMAKVNAQLVGLWSRILDAVPGSRLLLKNNSLNDAGTRRRYLSLFEGNGITGDRIELLGHTVSLEEHLGMYNRVDIALDTFPYNGTTTTCEALWMGVPVMTLAGDRHAGRVGASLLSCLDMDPWIARSADEFVAGTVRHAADRAHLAQLRAGLRKRVADSVLCDATGFAATVEQAYRDVWRQWCGSRQ